MTSLPDPAEAEYLRRVLETYRRTPGTTGHVRPADRRLARQLLARQVAVQTIDDAFLLASVRRFGKATPASSPPTVRSLSYFLPVIEELLREPFPDAYRQYLAGHLARALVRLGVPT